MAYKIYEQVFSRATRFGGRAPSGEGSVIESKSLSGWVIVVIIVCSLLLVGLIVAIYTSVVEKK